MGSRLTLDGGIALVTGAAQGIGKETALAFAEAGAKGVIFADINQQGVEAAAEESYKYARHAEYRALAVRVDLTNMQSVQDMVELTVKEFGRIDYAVNSAGIEMEHYTSFTPAVDLDVFAKMNDTNITGAVRFVRAVMGAMSQQEPTTFPGTSRHASRSLGRGSIVLMGSLNSLMGAPGVISYATAKHAVIGIMKSAGESFPSNSSRLKKFPPGDRAADQKTLPSSAVDALALQSEIRVNAVCPGFVDTPMVQNSMSKNPAVKYAIETITPLRRMATVDEVADYIVFLSSPSASFINGTALAIDAGFTLPAPPPLPTA